MALTEIKTSGIADDAVTTDKLANAINTERTGKIANVVEDTSPQLGGNLASNGNNILFADGDTAKFGTGNDLAIYHDGGGNNIINSANNGTLKFQRGGSDVFEIKSTGLQGLDNKNIMLGNSDDLKLYHNGSNSYIDSATGSFYIRDGTTEKVRINGYGTAITGGLLFGTDTAAANALSDYEEGNWSPTDLSGSTYNVASGAAGKYVKIGAVVHAWAQFGTDTTGSVSTGDRVIMGDLPFNVNTINNPPVTVTINYTASTYSTAKGSVSSSNEIAFTVTQTTGHPRNGSGFYVQVTYYTNS